MTDSGRGDAAEVGWLRAHVRIGRGYPIIAVRVVRRARAGGGVVVALDSEHPFVVNTAAYATGVARALDELDVSIRLLKVEASLAADGPAAALDLSVDCDAPTRHLEQGEVTEVARRVLNDARTASTWQLGEAVVARVAVSQVEEHAETAPVEAVAAHTTELAADGDSKEQVRPRRRRVLLLVAAAAVVLGLAVALASNLQSAPSSVAIPDEEPLEAAGPVGQPTPLEVVPTAVAVPTQPPVRIEPTPVPSPVPSATPTVLEAPTSARQPRAAEVLAFTPERQSGLAWPNDRQGVAWFTPEGYHLRARTPGAFVAVGVFDDQQLSSGTVSATFRKVGGPSGGGAGIVVGDQGPGPRDGVNQRGNFVVFEVGDKGEVGVWRRQDNKWVDILGWTPSAAVNDGSRENTLEVTIANGDILFHVNGTAIPLQETPEIASGGVGVFLGGDSNEVLLSRLSITRLD